MIRRAQHMLVLAAVVVATVLVSAVPAGAQQLVDAGKEGDGSGGLAFVLFALLVFICGGALFFMDHVRRRRVREEEDVPR
jgi:hypothetical protein